MLRTRGQLHERALAIRQKMLGPEHSDTVDSLLVLAMRPAMARGFFREHGPSMSVRSRSHSRCSVQRLQAPIAYAPICPAYYFLLANQQKRWGRCGRPCRTRQRSWTLTTPGPRTAPASLPTRSMRLGAQRRQRRCGSGMGSRDLRTLSPYPLQNEFSHPGWALRRQLSPPKPTQSWLAITRNCPLAVTNLYESSPALAIVPYARRHYPPLVGAVVRRIAAVHLPVRVCANEGVAVIKASKLASTAYCVAVVIVAPAC